MERKQPKTTNQKVYVQFMVACLLLVMLYTISQAMAAHQQVLENLCERVQQGQGSKQTVETAKAHITDLLGRMEQTEQDVNDALCKLSELEDEYTGCAGEPVEAETDADSWGFESFDEDTEDISDVLSDLMRYVKTSELMN